MQLPRFTAALLTFCTTLASANLIDHGSFSTDTATGLEWLDVTATAGLSYAAVKSGAGGWVSNGWRYATQAEISELFATHVGNGPEAWYGGTAFNNSLSLIRQLGVSISFNNNEGVQQIFGANEPTQISLDGYFDDGTANSTVGIAELLAHFQEATPGGNPAMSSRWVAYNDFWSNGSLSAGAGFGSYLVRPSSSVPEPSSGMLSLIAFAAAFLASRREMR